MNITIKDKNGYIDPNKYEGLRGYLDMNPSNVYKHLEIAEQIVSAFNILYDHTVIVIVEDMTVEGV